MVQRLWPEVDVNALAKWIADGERFDLLPLPGPEPVPMVELEELCLSVGGAAQVWLNPATGKVVVRRAAAAELATKS